MGPIDTKEELLAAMLRFVTHTPTCWLWAGGKTTGGYGTYTTASRFGLSTLVHRAIYELTQGVSIKNKVLLHSCDTPACCNPDHLTPGTQGENLKDCVEKGRHPIAARTHCPKGHLLPTAREGRNRVCRPCKREHYRTFNQRRSS